MISTSIQREFPYPLSLIKQIILDVSKYNQFIPYCNHVKLLEEYEKEFIAELSFQYKDVKGSYISKTVFDNNLDNSIIIISADQMPIHYLKNIWELTSYENKTLIGFEIELDLKSPIYNKAMSLFFPMLTKKIMNAFELRAKEIYGRKKL